jgi:hypothetical protein
MGNGWRHRGAGDRRRDKEGRGPVGEDGSNAEVAREAHSMLEEAVTHGVSGPQTSNVLLQSTTTGPLYTV